VVWLNISDNLGGGGRGSFSSASNTLTAGNWYHVVGIIRGPTDMSIYVNGVDVGGTYSGSANVVLGYSISSGRIGTDPSFTPGSFGGIIDEVGFWNRALSASEVATLYHAGNGNPFGNTSCGFSY
jgi:hypothetical protein